VMMDLAHAHRPDLAHALLDGWLEATGDFDAVALLDDERAYRAMVRAKVAALRAAQDPDAAVSQASRVACAGYLALAASFAQRPAALLVITHGLSGSGKSVLSAALAAELGAVRLRSDVERKRARGLASQDRSGAHGALYAPAARDAVYALLAERAAQLLAAGWPVVVDAAFLSRAQRRRFADLAAAVGVRFVIADLQAPDAVLRSRLAVRAARGTDASDADLAVLDVQLRTHEPLDDGERARAFAWQATDAPNRERVAGAWQGYLDAHPGGAPHGSGGSAT
jgi:predicted kinase